MISATNSEELRTTERVIGKYIINFPIVPGQKPSGKKAANVVAVEAMIGHAISPIPCFAACLLGIPSLIKLYTFSTTTIPLSTSIPSPMTNPNRTMVFRVKPKAERINSDNSIDSGMANPTNNAFRNPKKNIKTKTTRITPKMILFTKSLTWFSVFTD